MSLGQRFQRQEEEELAMYSIADCVSDARHFLVNMQTKEAMGHIFPQNYCASFTKSVVH